MVSGELGSIFGFLVDKVALEEVSLTLFDFPLPVMIAPVLCIHSSVIRRREAGPLSERRVGDTMPQHCNRIYK
jgi:hypothetical protein